MRIPIDRAENVAPTDALSRWLQDILALIGDEQIIDEDLIFRVVARFGQTDEAGGARGAWVAVWQFLRRHEGSRIRTRWEPARPRTEAILMRRQVGPIVARRSQAGGTMWRGSGASILRLDPVAIGYLRFLMVAVMLCVVASAAIPLLLRR